MDAIAQRFPSSSSSTSSSRSAGGEWTGNLFFYPDMDDGKKPIKRHVITKDELRRFVRKKTSTIKEDDRLEKLFGEDEEIELVRVYSNPLKRETWWSIEKNVQSITIQTSKDGRQIIRDCIGRKRRPVGPTTPNTRDRDLPANKNATVYKLIQHIHDGRYLNDFYNLKNSNCQHFADRIFEFLAIPPNDRFRRNLIRTVFTVIITCSILFVFYALFRILSIIVWTKFR
jgi:hypothetical protein